MLKKFLVKIIEKSKIKINEIEKAGRIAEERKIKLLSDIEEYKMEHGLRYHSINNDTDNI